MSGRLRHCPLGFATIRFKLKTAFINDRINMTFWVSLFTFQKVACFLDAFYHDILLADGLGTYGQWKVSNLILNPKFIECLATV